MLVLISYDVETATAEGAKRLRKIAKICQDYGQRVQNSVFECLVAEDQMVRLKATLDQFIDKKKDSIRIYYLGNNYLRKIDQLGKPTSFDMTSELII